MTKNEAKEINHIKGLLAAGLCQGSYAARALSALARSARTLKSASEIVELIRSTPDVNQHVQWIDGVPIPL